MVWQQVNPRFVRQDYPGLRAQWYCDSAQLGGGDLILWLDARERVAAFKLSHDEWPSLRHLVAEWRAGSAPWVQQEVSRAEHGRGRARHLPPTEVPDGHDPDAALRLLHYFTRNAAAIAPRLRQTIRAVLSEATGTP